MSIKSIALGLTLGLIASVSNAAIVMTPNPVSLEWTLIYPGNGNIQIDISTPVGNCGGIWLSPTAPGYREALAVVLAAKTNSKLVYAWVDNASISPTSGSRQYCLAYAISMQ